MNLLRFRTRSFFGLWALVLGLWALDFSPASAQETQTLYLSGHGKDDAIPWNFLCTTGAKSGVWTNLPVPSQWDVHGFGTLNYHKDLTNGFQEHGLYEHDFIVPQDWSGKRIFLVFEGVMTDTSAKLNGEPVGPMHQGGFYRFKYEVTSFVKFGDTNSLEVDVAKHSANQSINNAERLADYWVFGGIYRPVHLDALPPQFINRVAIDARADGNFALDASVDGGGGADTLTAQLQTTNGDNIGDAISIPVAIGSNTTVHLQTSVMSPKLWSAETPNLYRVVVSLKENGKTVHQLTQRFGFRTFEVRDGDGLYLNGQRLILKGVNRHSFWPDSGRTLSEAVHLLDIETMKDANINAVRMSHYPPDAQFLDLCDELGLYVLDELGGWHHYYDNTVGPKLVHEMVVRDVNHPAILFWDNGNEGGFNTNFDHLFPELDPQHRRVLHPWMAFNGVNTAHYLQYDQAETAVTGIPLYYHPNGKTFADPADTNKYIYMPTEFIHGLYDGGGGAGLDDYWRLMTGSKYLGGGFIWAFLDDGLKRPDTGQIDVAGNQAPDGIVGPYRQREGSYYAIKEIWSPIQVTRESSGNVFDVENHFAFTDTRDCKFTWQFRRFPEPQATNSGYVPIIQGTFDSPSIPPGGKGQLKLDVPYLVRNADALAVQVMDPHGRELYTWVWPLKSLDSHHFDEATAEHHAVPADTNGLIVVNAGDLTASFSKSTGLLVGVQRGSQMFSLTNGPRLAVAGQTATLKDIHFDDDGPDAIITAKYDGNLKSVAWRVNGNGWIDCQYTYAAEGTNDFIGVIFDYPENLVKHKRWLGDGPFRVWQNRLRGVTLGVWENDYNDTLTGYRDWIYPEFKGFFAHVRWLQLETDEGLITVINHGGTLYTQVLTPDFPPAKLVGKAFAPVPAGGLGFLDAIPPIGSKFKEATFGGPQGQPYIAHGDYSGSLSFYFGPLPK